MADLRRVLTISAIVALSMGLVGCGPAGGPIPAAAPGADPTPSAVPSASPSETPDPRDNISAIVVDGDSVFVKLSDGGVYRDIPFTTDAETAIAQLSEAIRLPEVRSTLPAGGCFRERPQATWGGLSFIWGTDWQRPGAAQFIATAAADRTTNGIPVTVLGGQMVGASEADVFAGAPGAYSDDYVAWKTLHYDVVRGDPVGTPEQYWGALAIIQGGVLTSFSSPVNYFFDC